MVGLKICEKANSCKFEKCPSKQPKFEVKEKCYCVLDRVNRKLVEVK